MPSVSSPNTITSTAQVGDKVIATADIADSAVDTLQIAANAVIDAKIGAHTTTKITSPFSLVTGTVPIAQGGTGQITKAPAYLALAPETTQGDISYHDGTTIVRLGPGTSGQFLKTQGAAANPVWASATSTPNWVDEGSISWAAETTDKTLTFINTPKKIYKLIINLVSTVTGAFNLQLNTHTDANYRYAEITETATALTVTSGATSFGLKSASTSSGVVGEITLEGVVANGLLHVSADLSGIGLTLIKGSYLGTPVDLASIKILVGGLTVTGVVHAYSLNP